MEQRTYLNPYLICALSWLLVLILYNLGWSNLYPPISTSLFVFLIFNILITASFGFWLFYKGYIIYNPIEYNLQRIRKLSVIYVVLNILEVIYSGHIPVLSILMGGEVGNDDFGIPMLHPLIVTFGIFLGLYVFHMIMSTGKKEKLILLPYYLLSFLGVFIVFGRGLMFLTFFGCFLIYVMSKVISKKVVPALIIVAICILYLFGLAGNIRIGEAGVRITSVGQATTEFEESNIPSEFFWSYIYFSSPVANLEHNLQTDKIHTVDISVLKSLFVSEIIPQFISNKLISENQRVEPNLITQALNVSSVYTRCYAIAGWTGIWIMFVYIFFYLFIVLLIVPPKSQYFVVAIVVLNMLMIGNIFDNMMNYILSYTLFYPILFMVNEKIKFVIRDVED